MTVDDADLDRIRRLVDEGSAVPAELVKPLLDAVAPTPESVRLERTAERLALSEGWD